MKAPVLVKADLNKEFIIHSDASLTHVGAGLMQTQEAQSLKLIAYFSKKGEAM